MAELTNPLIPLIAAELVVDFFQIIEIKPEQRQRRVILPQRLANRGQAAAV